MALNLLRALLVLATPVLALRQASTTCSSGTFTAIKLPGADIKSITATYTLNYSYEGIQFITYFASNYTGLNFCNVSIAYGHPGWNDTINVNVLLPTDNWNGRFYGGGGGGNVASGQERNSVPAVARGFATAITDAGHSNYLKNADSWSLTSDGNVNWYQLQNFASRAINDMTIIGQNVTETFYGQKPSYSYFVGCSTGGRQGLQQAQRYPELYDGILAAAPAVDYAKLLVGLSWGQFILTRLENPPSQCELNAITSAAIDYCDDLDGVVDGIVANDDACSFNASTLVGKAVDCNGIPSAITQAGADVAQAYWGGAQYSNGSKAYPGWPHNAPFNLLVNTNCSSSGNCSRIPWYQGEDWIRLQVMKSYGFDFASMSHQQYDEAFHISNNEYESSISANDVDLSKFRKRNGKMITWQGLADQGIPPNVTRMWYERVRAFDSNVGDYYRLFEAPGVWHCGGGTGAYPNTTLQALMDWVEKGEAPETLEARSVPDENGTIRYRDLCQYPLVSVYQSGDINLASSYSCKIAY